MVVDSLDLDEAWAWLDYCLGEVQEAMAGVKAAAGGPRPAARGYPGFAQASAEITTLRGRCRSWRTGNIRGSWEADPAAAPFAGAEPQGE